MTSNKRFFQKSEYLILLVITVLCLVIGSILVYLILDKKFDSKEVVSGGQTQKVIKEEVEGYSAEPEEVEKSTEEGTDEIDALLDSMDASSQDEEEELSSF